MEAVIGITASLFCALGLPATTISAERWYSEKSQHALLMESAQPGKVVALPDLPTPSAWLGVPATARFSVPCPDRWDDATLDSWFRSRAAAGDRLSLRPPILGSLKSPARRIMEWNNAALQDEPIEFHGWRLVRLSERIDNDGLAAIVTRKGFYGRLTLLSEPLSQPSLKKLKDLVELGPGAYLTEFKRGSLDDRGARLNVKMPVIVSDDAAAWASLQEMAKGLGKNRLRFQDLAATFLSAPSVTWSLEADDLKTLRSMPRAHDRDFRLRSWHAGIQEGKDFSTIGAGFWTFANPINATIVPVGPNGLGVQVELLHGGKISAAARMAYQGFVGAAGFDLNESSPSSWKAIPNAKRNLGSTNLLIEEDGSGGWAAGPQMLEPLPDPSSSTSKDPADRAAHDETVAPGLNLFPFPKAPDGTIALGRWICANGDGLALVRFQAGPWRDVVTLKKNEWRFARIEDGTTKLQIVNRSGGPAKITLGGPYAFSRPGGRYRLRNP